MRRTTYNHVLAVPLLDIANHLDGSAVATDVVDTLVDGTLFRVASVLAVTGTMTNGEHSLTLQHSTTDATGDFVDVPAAQVQGDNPIILDTTDDDETFEIGYIGGLRYLRLVRTTTDNASGTATYGAVLLLGQPTRAPVPRS